MVVKLRQSILLFQAQIFQIKWLNNALCRTNDMGISSIHQAVSANNLQCVKSLVKHGARVTHTDKRGLSPLDVAKVLRCILFTVPGIFLMYVSCKLNL